MKNILLIMFGIAITFIAGYYFRPYITDPENSSEIVSESDTVEIMEPENMATSNLKLGAFSLSLSVKNLLVSKAFYEKLGFVVHGGGIEMNYLIMKNENALIGLFQGMFDGNILTFNPGWDERAEELEQFDDIRVIQNHLKSNSVALMSEASDSTTGPASIMLNDPDGNLILIDQHR